MQLRTELEPLLGEERKRPLCKKAYALILLRKCGNKKLEDGLVGCVDGPEDSRALVCRKLD